MAFLGVFWCWFKTCKNTQKVNKQINLWKNLEFVLVVCSNELNEIDILYHYFNFIAENKFWSVWTVIYSTLTFFGFYYLHINDWPFDIPLIIMGIIWILIGIEAMIIFCICKPNTNASMIPSVLNSSISVTQNSQEIITNNQGYRNRYSFIDWPSGSCIFYVINNGLWFWHIYMNLTYCLVHHNGSC